MDTIKFSWLYLTASISCKWGDMDVSRNRHAETILRMMILTGFPSMKPSSWNTLKVGRKAIAIDPSFIPKSGSKTPWIGYFWSDYADEYKRGLEITGIGAIDVDNHECMTLGSVQTPDNATL